MIGYLHGSVKRLSGSVNLVDVQGVGYLVDIGLRDCVKLPQGSEKVSLWIYTHVREDQLKLFGFLTIIDKELFEILLSVSGVGPKVALAIISTLSAADVVKAIELGRSDILTDVPGIGARVAERLVLELKPKIAKWNRLAEIDLSPKQKIGAGLFDTDESDQQEASVYKDVKSALENLGYREKQIKPILKGIEAENQTDDFNTALKSALQRLRSNSGVETMR